jgi:hypothetical protein
MPGQNTTVPDQASSSSSGAANTTPSGTTSTEWPVTNTNVTPQAAATDVDNCNFAAGILFEPDPQIGTKPIDLPPDPGLSYDYPVTEDTCMDAITDRANECMIKCQQSREDKYNACATVLRRFRKLMADSGCHLSGCTLAEPCDYQEFETPSCEPTITDSNMQCDLPVTTSDYCGRSYRPAGRTACGIGGCGRRCAGGNDRRVVPRYYRVVPQHRVMQPPVMTSSAGTMYTTYPGVPMYQPVQQLPYEEMDRIPNGGMYYTR